MTQDSPAGGLTPREVATGLYPVSGRYRGAAGLQRFTDTTAAIAAGGAHTEVIDITTTPALLAACPACTRIKPASHHLAS